jgi:hypothetical protein
MVWCVKNTILTTYGHTKDSYTDCRSTAHERDVASLALCHGNAPRPWANRRTQITDYRGTRPGVYCSRFCCAVNEGWWYKQCPDRVDANGNPVKGRAVSSHPFGVQSGRPCHVGDDRTWHFFDFMLENTIAGTVLQ